MTAVSSKNGFAVSDSRIGGTRKSDYSTSQTLVAYNASFNIKYTSCTLSKAPKIQFNNLSRKNNGVRIFKLKNIITPYTLYRHSVSKGAVHKMIYTTFIENYEF